MIRNPHDKQIPEMSLGVQFDQEFMEKTWKRLVANCSAQTVCRGITPKKCKIMQNHANHAQD